jgi:hypothetical protein
MLAVPPSFTYAILSESFTNTASLRLALLANTVTLDALAVVLVTLLVDTVSGSTGIALVNGLAWLASVTEPVLHAVTLPSSVDNVLSVAAPVGNDTVPVMSAIPTSRFA